MALKGSKGNDSYTDAVTGSVGRKKTDEYAFDASRTVVEDDTTYLQRLLDEGAGGAVTFPARAGKYVVKRPLVIRSGTTLTCEDGVILWLANGVNNPILVNENHASGTDSDITVIGGTWDGNNRNQVRANYTIPVLNNSSMYILRYGQLIVLSGVSNLTLQRMTVKDPQGFSIQLTDVEDFLVEDIVFDCNNATGNEDGVHVNGYAHRGVIRRISGHTNDDLVALNSDEGDYRSLQDNDITDVLIDGIDGGDDGFTGVRLLSRNACVSNITIRNVSGKFKHFIASFTHWAKTGYVSGMGHFKDIAISNVTATSALTTGVSDGTGLIWFQQGVSDVGTVRIENAHRVEGSNQRNSMSYIRVDAGVSIDKLILKDVDQTVYNNQKLLDNAGTIGSEIWEEKDDPGEDPGQGTPFDGLLDYSGEWESVMVGDRLAVKCLSSGTLSVKGDVKLMRALVVGGGGVVEVNPDTGVLWHQGDEASITVGAGGDNYPDAYSKTGNPSAAGGNGGYSELAFGATSYRALGGGGGSGAGEQCTIEGVASGGGAAQGGTTPGAGTEGQGHAGGMSRSSGSYTNPGGGGGAGGAGGDAASNSAGAGGLGFPSDITGTQVTYGAGGGGGAHANAGGTAGAGGSAWAGSGATITSGYDANRCDGKDGTGSGGGGGGYSSYISNENKLGGKGGSGVVVLLLAVPPVDPQGTVTAVPTDEGGAVAVKIGDLGLGASSATVSYAVALGEGEYGASTLVKSDCALGETVLFELTGLMLGKSYRLKVVIENNLGKSTTLETSFVPQVPGVSDSFAYTGTFETVQLGDSLVIKCLSSGTLTVGANLSLTRALVVGGGGAGGWNRGGGGGGGGVVEVNPDVGVLWHQGDEASITVGAGGDNKQTGSNYGAMGGDGGPSALAFGALSYTALGGGGGGGAGESPDRGGDGVCSSGGGAAEGTEKAAGRGTPGQGYDGGALYGSNPGGGGGAGGPGGNAQSGKAGDGGAGVACDITNEGVVYGAGGGGGNYSGKCSAGAGGSAWAGSGATSAGHTAERCDGKDGTGSGGGGGAWDSGLANQNKYGGKGGSGVVILVVRVPVEKPVCTVDVQPEGTQAAVTVDLGYPGDGASVCDVKYACHIDLKGKGYGELVTAASGKVEGESVAFDLTDLVPAHKYLLKVVVTNDLGKERTFEIPFATESSVIGPVSFSVTSARRKGTAVQASFARTQTSGAADVTLYAAPSYAGDDPASWASSSVVGSFADGQSVLANVLSGPLAASVKCIRFACGGEWSEPLLLEELEVVPGENRGLVIFFGQKKNSAKKEVK